jgi:putative oxidoreductase
LQRLFSSFADGWPGSGLLIQRLLIGAALLHAGLDTFFTCVGAGATPICATPICLSGAQVIGAVGGLFLILGLWTPVVGFLTAILQAWIALTSGGDHRVPLFLAIFAATLAMIGPGAWSVDARLFGRKHIIPNGSRDFPLKS